MDHRAIQALFESLAVEAGAAIMAIRAQGFDVANKECGSPVTLADEAAEAIILAGLAAQYPELPVVAEESIAAGRQPDISGGRFILVDPLDGTKEFIKGSDEFTVNIALVEDGMPVVGVVYAPAQARIWAGGPDGASVADIAAGDVGRRIAMRCRACAAELDVVASASHRTPETEAFIARYPGASTVSVGSSLKFCLLAEGKADLYPRFGRTMEWDTAAGDAVLRAAGGLTVNPDGATFVYGKTAQAQDSDFANGWFIATSTRALLRQG